MKNPPTSYKDPYYADLAATMEGKFGLPSGLLQNIITKGERSNADQVSSAGARSVAQITPATRKAALKQFGVDAYASAENALEVAARILKQSYDATGGDVQETVARYHAGTGGARGPVNRAYVARVTGQEVEAAPAARQTSRQIPLAPPRTVEAYNAGTMTPAEKVAFDQGLKRGQFRLPEGAVLTATPAKPDPSVAVIPQRIIDRFNNHSDMTDGQRALIERDVAAGNLRLPEGVKLARPAPRTAADYGGMAGRAIAQGIGGMADQIGTALNPIAGAQNMLRGAVQVADIVNPQADSAERLKQPLAQPIQGNRREAAAAASDSARLATPGTPLEQMLSAGVEGGVQGAMMGPIGGAEGLALRLATDTASGAASGVASDATRQAGGGQLAQLAVGALAGGLPAVAGARIAQKFGPKVAQVVESTPRQVLMDETGQLTDEGREIVARAGVEPDQIKAAYDEAATPQAEPGGQTVRVFEGQEHPVEVVGAAERNAADGRDYVPVRTPDGQEGYVPADEVISKPAETPEAAPAAETAAPAPEAPIPASAAARMAEAEKFGVKLTKGQATKDFETQAAESDLSGTNTAEGRAVREHLNAQAEAIKAAADTFRASLGDTSLSAADRGAAVKAGLRDLADQGKAGVTQAYKLVRDLASELGDNAKGLTALDPAPIRAGVREILADDSVSDATRKGLAQIAAKYGLIGESPKHVPDTGMTTVMVRDAENNLVRGPAFAGKVEPLDLTNAEKFRQRINDLYDKMATRNPQEALKPILDDAVAAAAERAAKEGFGDVGKAATEARDAFKAQKATFEAKDVVDSLISWKRGTQTDAVLPEKVWSMVFGQGPDALSNIKKLRAILLNKPTEASKAAWEAIKAQAVADLFQKALVVNGNGGEGAISGAKLNSAVQKFGSKKLQLILGDEQFNAFMRLKRVIADATIPLPKIPNPSGSGHLIARFLGNTAKGVMGAAKIVPGIGGVVDVVAGLAKTGAERTQAERVAKGATEFTPAEAAAVDAKASPKPQAAAKPQLTPDEAIRQFLELGSSNRILAPLLASSAASQKEGDQ